MLAKTQYAILGVTQTESQDGLRRVFRQLVKRYHPDRAGPAATSAFQQIINAYRVLERAEWRRHYDEGVNDALQRQIAASALIPAGEEPSAALPTIIPTIELRVLSLVALEALAHRVNQRLHGIETAGDDEWGPLDLIATLRANDAERGGATILVLPAWYPCAECGGTGRVGNLPCPACDGETVELKEERIHVRIPPLRSAYMRLELPVPCMGVVGKYLRLHIRVVEA
jgi:hypothetical protein